MARDATSAGGTDPLREYGLIGAELAAPADEADLAREVFESAERLGGPLGLFPEEIDAATGAFLGNHPQAISHAAHLGAAHALCAREGRARDREALA